MHRSLNSGHVQYFKFATLCFLWMAWREGGNAFPMWHHSINLSHVARDHGSTTASQPWKALISGSNKMCRCFFCFFPCILLPLSCSFFAILAALRLWWLESIVKWSGPTWSNHVVKWSKFCPHPRRTWQAAACAVAGPGARAVDTVYGKGARTYSPPGRMQQLSRANTRAQTP